MRKDVVKLRYFFFQAEDGIRDLVRSRGLGDVYKRQVGRRGSGVEMGTRRILEEYGITYEDIENWGGSILSLIHI